MNPEFGDTGRCEGQRAERMRWRPMVLPHDTRRGIPRRSGYRKWRTESTDSVPWARLLKGSQSGRSVPAGSKAAGTRPNGSGSCSRQAEVRHSGAVRETSLRRKRVIRRLLQAARLRGAASPEARPQRSGPPPRPAQPGHSWPVPRTPMGRRVRPPPRPPSQTWCPGRCRE